MDKGNVEISGLREVTAVSEAGKTSLRGVKFLQSLREKKQCRRLLLSSLFFFLLESICNPEMSAGRTVQFSNNLQQEITNRDRQQQREG